MNLEEDDLSLEAWWGSPSGTLPEQNVVVGQGAGKRTGETSPAGVVHLTPKAKAIQFPENQKRFRDRNKIRGEML